MSFEILWGMRSKSARLAVQAAPEEGAARAPACRVGRLLRFVEGGRVLVEIASGTGPPQRLAARRLLRLDRAFRQAVFDQREVALLFDAGDPEAPIIAGLLDPEEGDAAAEDGAEAVSHPRLPAMVVEADADGRRVTLVAQDEVVLACGEASITLRRNGRVVIVGTEVESRAAGAQLIRGAQIRLN
jgi:hypothetical protein